MRSACATTSLPPLANPPTPPTPPPIPAVPYIPPAPPTNASAPPKISASRRALIGVPRSSGRSAPGISISTGAGCLRTSANPTAWLRQTLDPAGCKPDITRTGLSLQRSANACGARNPGRSLSEQQPARARASTLESASSVSQPLGVWTRLLAQHLNRFTQSATNGRGHGLSKKDGVLVSFSSLSTVPQYSSTIFSPRFTRNLAFLTPKISLKSRVFLIPVWYSRNSHKTEQDAGTGSERAEE